MKKNLQIMVEKMNSLKNILKNRKVDEKRLEEEVLDL